ncbi:hypothetical protein TNCV_2138691 [Trichonephila clavipes]|nr:hypothetical protein TNCV_2138691 [Trichonephila clavipes]
MTLTWLYHQDFTKFLLNRHYKSSSLVCGTTPDGGVDGWASRTEQVMNATIPNALQSGEFVWFEDTGAPNEGATCAWMAADETVTVRVHFL